MALIGVVIDSKGWCVEGEGVNTPTQGGKGRWKGTGTDQCITMPDEELLSPG